MSTNNLSLYARTPINSKGYLDILSPRPVPANKTDILFQITTQYTYRPDLLAHITYGRKDLWWVFAQRNLDVLKDPIFDFVAGTKIYLPDPRALRTSLGI
jgi:hypothetical protein|tara:strand:+ start:824 stop:1123 length:300 start_codon:yes stop_codon:yes gene_type:complete